MNVLASPDPSGTINKILPTDSKPVVIEQTPTAEPAPPSVEVNISQEAQNLAASEQAPSPQVVEQPNEAEDIAPTPAATEPAGAANAISAFQDVAQAPAENSLDLIA